jgi:hypothetical protein
LRSIADFGAIGDDWREMPDTEHANGAIPEGAGILGALPRTRPQRASARRAKAGGSGASATSTDAKAGQVPPRTAQARTGRSAAGAGKTRPQSAKAPPRSARAPLQGYEAEGPGAGTEPLAPPSATDVVASLVEAASELAGAGIRSGAHVLRGLLSRR